MSLKAKSGRKAHRLTPVEDAQITAAAMSDPDAQPLSAEWFEGAKPAAEIPALAKLLRRGRPPLENGKVPTSMRYDRDVLDAFKATGPGWQTRMNAALREWAEAHGMLGR